MTQSLFKRSERIDIVLMFKIGAAIARFDDESPEEQEIVAELIPELNGVQRRARANEIRSVMRFWPRMAREDAVRFGASWHALTYPALLRDQVDRDEMVAWARDWCLRWGVWPTVGTVRRHLKHPSNHRPPGEATPGQQDMDL